MLNFRAWVIQLTMYIIQSTRGKPTKFVPCRGSGYLKDYYYRYKMCDRNSYCYYDYFLAGRIIESTTTELR